MSTEEEKKLQEANNAKTDKTQEGISNTQDKTKNNIGDTFKTGKDFEKEQTKRFGENPTPESVLTELKKSSPETFKEAKTYDEAIKIIEEGQVGSAVKVGQNKPLHERLKKNVKHETVSKKPIKQLTTYEAAENATDEELNQFLAQYGFDQNGKIKKSEKPENKKEETKIEKSEKESEKSEKEKKKFEEETKKKFEEETKKKIEEAKKKLEEETKKSEKEPEKAKEATKPEEVVEEEKAPKTGKGFFGTIGGAMAWPFKKSWQATKWTAKTAWRGAKLAGNSTIALTRSAPKTVRAPVGWTSHVLGYKSVKEGTKAWAQDYKDYRSFKK